MRRLLCWLMVFLGAMGYGQEAGRPPGRLLRDFGDIPALHDGRVMPMDTYARLALLQVSGRSKLGREPAVSWFARVLFDPESTRGDAVFLVNHPEVLDAMGVERSEELPGRRKPSTRRFSYAHLLPGMEALAELARGAERQEAGERGLVENEALRVYGNVVLYRQLASVFAHTRPIPGIELSHVKGRMGIEGDVSGLSYHDLKDRMGAVAELVREAFAEQDFEKLNDEQKEAVGLANFMFNFRGMLADLPLPILPAAPHGEPHWLAPLDALHDEAGDVELMRAGDRAAGLARAWKGGDWEEAGRAVEEISAFSRGRMKQVREVGLASLEARFNRAEYFFRAKLLYVVAFLLSCGALVGGNGFLRKAALVPLGLGLLLHVVGLAWRVFLTARPPVTNLYGTFLFVGLVCLLLALLVEVFQRNALGLFVGSFVAVTFLFLADRFGAEGDTMTKVVAVLASNFWLSTHVLAVTTGYAGVWIAGVFGHIWLVLRLLGRSGELLEKVRKPMEGLLGFGLTFSFLGTMLGGVWADQSWGRFWGWDPKENGALLIVLWTAAVYHARVAGLIRETGMAAGAVVGCVMVMVAWLGVNLLGVGLHSYGFTKSMFTGFFGFLIFEGVFLAVVLVGLRLRRRGAEAPAV